MGSVQRNRKPGDESWMSRRLQYREDALIKDVDWRGVFAHDVWANVVSFLPARSILTLGRMCTTMWELSRHALEAALNAARPKCAWCDKPAERVLCKAPTYLYIGDLATCGGVHKNTCATCGSTVEFSGELYAKPVHANNECAWYIVRPDTGQDYRTRHEELQQLVLFEGVCFECRDTEHVMPSVPYWSDARWETATDVIEFPRGSVGCTITGGRDGIPAVFTIVYPPPEVKIRACR